MAIHLISNQSAVGPPASSVLMEDMTTLGLALLIPPFQEPRAPLTPTVRGHWSPPQPSEHRKDFGEISWVGGGRDWECWCFWFVQVWFCLMEFKMICGDDFTEFAQNQRSRWCKNPNGEGINLLVHEIWREALGACLGEKSCCLRVVNGNAGLQNAH